MTYSSQQSKNEIIIMNFLEFGLLNKKKIKEFKIDIISLVSTL